VLAIALLASLLQQQATANARDPLDRVPLPEPARQETLQLVAEGRFDELAAIDAHPELAPAVQVRDELLDGFTSATRLTVVLAAALQLAGVGVALLVRDPAGQAAAARWPARALTARS
jgi:hypothetical protein